MDITQYVSNSDTSNQLNLWLPDISFYEGVNINELAQMVKLFPNGTFLWSRHLMTTLTEENMNLLQYPLDTQNFSLTFQSYGYCSNFLNIVLWPTPVGFNDDPQEGENYIELNQLWSYNSYSAYVQIVNSPIIFNPNRKYSTGYFNLSFSRQSFGIVYRLALPIAIFLVLVGFSFWADNIHKRIDVTLQMLLVVAALYLVIGQIIPFVGYFTRVDLYVTTAFFILAVTTGVHFVTLLLDAKGKLYTIAYRTHYRIDYKKCYMLIVCLLVCGLSLPFFVVLKYPANAVLRDSLVYVFRVLWVPCALVLFMVFFETSDPGIIAAVVVVSFVSVTNAILKRKYLKQSFKVSILNLRQKEKAILNALAQYKEDVAKSEGKFIRKVKKLSWFEEKLLQYTRGWYAYAARNAVVEEEVEQQAKDTAAANNERASVVGKGGSRGSIKEIELAMLQQIYTRDSMSISMPTSYNPGFVQTHFGQTNPLQQASSQQQQAAAVAAVGTKYQQYDPYVDSDDESD